MNILYLSDTRFAGAPYRDASTRYRGYHFAEALVEIQHVADVGVIDIIDTDIIARYDVVVVLRPAMSRKMIRIANLCEQHNVVFIADFDDLIFSTEFADSSPQVKNGQATSEQIVELYNKHESAISLFRYVTASTQELCWQMQEKHPGAQVLHMPNGLSSYWLKYNSFVNKANAIRYNLVGDNDQCGGLISYLPGTRSHDHDFSIVENQLAHIANNNEHTVVQVVGALDFNESLFSDGKIQRGSWTDYINLPSLIANSWLTIAPLAPTIFNQSKSHIKFIESAAFGTPHISSNNPDVAQHNVEGLSVITSADQWSTEIDRYRDRDYYNQCSDALRNYALQACMAKASIPAFLSFIEQASQHQTHEDTVPLSQAG